MLQTDAVLDKAQELKAAGTAFALATVVRAESPTSAKPGAKAIVTAEGELMNIVTIFLGITVGATMTVDAYGPGLVCQFQTAGMDRWKETMVSLLADLTGDGKIENAFIRNGKLYIFNGKKRIYKSLKKMGGSLSFLTYDVNPGFKDSKPTTAAFEISPVAVDLDADGRRELLASAAERSILGSLKVSAGLTKTWISIFKYDGGRFSSGTLGEVTR